MHIILSQLKMNNFVSLYLMRNTLYLYTSKNGKVLRHNLNISISDYSPKDISSIENHIKKKRFPPQLEKYREYIEKEQSFIDSLIVKHREKYGVFPSVKEIKKLIEGGDINLNSEFLSVYREYLDLKIEDFNTKGSPTSSRDFVSFLNGMLDFEKFKNVRLKIRNIDETFLREYFKFLIDKRELGKGYKTRGGLNGRTIKKRFDVLKTYLKWLKEKKRVDRYTEISELISTGIFDRKSPVVKKLTLSVEQLKIISEYPIEDTKSPLFKARDMFLFCCSTGLRFSDLIKINRTNITEGGNGLFFLNGIAVKTDTPFNIELSNRTYEIFERNNFTLNLMSNQKANLYLKKLLEQIDEFQKFSSKYDYKDEQGQTHHYRLFELVSFHTARRSFITTLLDNRYSINEIMTRTGHSKPSTLEKYINPNETLGRTIIDIFDY